MSNEIPRPQGRVVSAPYGGRLRRRVVGMVVFLILAIGVSYVAVKTVDGQGVDTMMMEALGWQLGHVQTWDYLAKRLVSVLGIGVAMVVVALVAFARRRTPLAGRAIGVIVLANITTQVVKYLLERADLGLTYVFPNSLPSGHVTVAASVTVALVMVAPRYWRSVAVWVGWLVTAGMGLMVVILQWHRPSDVLVALMIVGVFALGLSPIESRPRHLRASHRTMSVLVVFCFGGAVVCGAVALWGFDVRQAAVMANEGYGFLAFVREHPTCSWVLSLCAALSIAGVAAAVMHELDRLSGAITHS